MPSAVAALNIGVGLCWGVTCGDMLEAMARITPSQPKDAMARIASRKNRTISLDPNLPGQISKRFFRRESKLLSEVQIDSKKDWVMKSSKIAPPPPKCTFLRSAYSGFCWIPPCSAASF
jgi:hypothetical protein